MNLFIKCLFHAHPGYSESECNTFQISHLLSWVWSCCGAINFVRDLLPAVRTSCSSQLQAMMTLENAQRRERDFHMLLQKLGNIYETTKPPDSFLGCLKWVLVFVRLAESLWGLQTWTERNYENHSFAPKKSKTFPWVQKRLKANIRWLLCSFLVQSEDVDDICIHNISDVASHCESACGSQACTRIPNHSCKGR